MPLTLPVLDDRNYEQLLAEAKQRIPVHTPEWTNFNVESDPGITLVELFAFLTDNLLYRANRIPERNRLKFLDLLGIPLQPATAAEGLIAIRNERGPVSALTLGAGVAVSAGNVRFLTRDDVTVLPLEAQVYYKKEITESDERYANLLEQHEAALEALAATREGEGLALDASLKPIFYETKALTLPTAGNPYPVLDLRAEAIDDAFYIALLAPKNVPLADVRDAIGHKTISIGVVPALTDQIAPLLPAGPSALRDTAPSLIYEMPDVVSGATSARYQRVPQLQAPDVLKESGIVQLILPEPAKIRTWDFGEPLAEGKGDFPPRLDDDTLRSRLVSWIRLRMPETTESETGSEPLLARFSWVGINAARVTQAVPVVNELLGQGNGEPDQVVVLANTPVLPDSLAVELQLGDNSWQQWRLTDDLLAAGTDEEVFTLDPEAGIIRFGTGLHGKRPPAGQRLRASYEYGGGPMGNVAVGEINTSPDVRLQGGYKITNPVPTSGGDDGETTSEGERNIPLYLRHRDRLVTEMDVRDITWRTPGVDIGRVDVLPQFYPPEPARDVPGVITVMVVPQTDRTHPLWPTPDRLFLRRVCNHLDPRRLVTTEIHVRGPEYVDVHLSVGVQVRQGYYRDQVVKDVRERLRTYLSALPPGGPEEEGWPRNRKLLKKELEAVAARVAGVDFINSMLLGVGAALNLEDYSSLTGLKLPRLATVEVRAGEAEDLATILGEDSGATAPAVEVVPIPVTKEVC